MHVLAALLFFLLPWQDDLSLGGIVIDVNQAAVREALVVLEHTTDRRRWEAMTSENGAFRFDRLPLGSYRVTVTKEGYFEAGTSIGLEAGKIIEFTLAPIEVLKDTVEVIARPEPINTDAVAAQQTVNDEVIQNIPYTGRRNFLNALSLMPGVMRDSYGQMHIHGSRPDQIRYQLDGINLTDPATGALSSNIPIDAIESVDMDLTAYSAEFGKGSGGVVRVHSQFINDRMRWDVTDFIPGVNFKRKTIGEFSPRLLVSGPMVHGKAWFMYSGSLRYVRTFNEDLTEGENRQNQTVADQLLKLQWNLRESHVLTLNLLHNSEYFGNLGLNRYRPLEATTNFLRRGSTIAISDRSAFRGTLFETVFQWTRRRESELAKGTDPLQVRPTGWRGNFFSDRRGRNNRLHFAQTIAWERSFRSVTHRLKAGGEFDHIISTLFLDRRGFQIYDYDGDVLSRVSFAGPHGAKVRNREYGFFIQDRMVFSPSFQLEFGLRADRERVTGRNNFAPRVAFSFLPLRNETSKISGGVAVFYDNIALINLQLPRMQRRITTSAGGDGRAPESVEPTDVRLSPSLANPYGVHWNLAWDHEWAPRWVSRLNYIQKRGHDQVRFAALKHANGFDLLVNNSGSSEYDAVEVTLDRPIRTNLRILASYIYSEARGRPSVSLDFPDPAVERISEAPLDWNTRHRFLSWGYFPFFFDASASYSIEARSGFPFTPVDDLTRVAGPYNGLSLPAHFVTNFSLEKEIPFFLGKRIAVRVGVLNAFNRFNPRFVDPNVNSPTFMRFSDSSARHLFGRVRLIKK